MYGGITARPRSYIPATIIAYDLNEAGISLGMMRRRHPPPLLTPRHHAWQGPRRLDIP